MNQISESISRFTRDIAARKAAMCEMLLAAYAEKHGRSPALAHNHDSNRFWILGGGELTEALRASEVQAHMAQRAAEYRTQTTIEPEEACVDIRFEGLSVTLSYERLARDIILKSRSVGASRG